MIPLLRLPAAAATTLATLAVMTCAAPVHAMVIDKQHYSYADRFPDVVCGVPVVHEVAGSGVFHVRVGKRDLASVFFGGGLYLEQLGLMLGGPHPLFPQEQICPVVRPLLLA